MIWNCRDKKIEYGKKVLIMGIINITPDSFSDGGEHFSPSDAVEYAVELEKQGADIIDFGAQSTRPGSNPISAEDEWARLEPVLKEARGRISCPISVDTYYPKVAEKSAKTGADIINDVSGIVSLEMAKIVKNSRLGWIIMHNGSASPTEVRSFFEKCIDECAEMGIEKNQLCFDMGIGFGKDYDENMRLLANVCEYKINDVPLLLGTSRKRVIGHGSLQDNPKERTYGNIAADTAAILDGVDIIRLHDVKNEKQGILMAQELKKYRNGHNNG